MKREERRQKISKTIDSIFDLEPLVRAVESTIALDEKAPFVFGLELTQCECVPLPFDVRVCSSSCIINLRQKQTGQIRLDGSTEYSP